ncbi:MAG: biotin/lipoyl-containing protein [Dehalococcoidia bacterium]|jgi:biotin carboxyl carrier protein|nr:biotin/lipoyl-containing protein [Dehalococcoidia bacterium]
MATRHRFLIDGHEHSVAVERDGGAVTVQIDDEDPVAVDATNSGLPGLFSVLVDGEPSTAYVSRRGAGFEVTVAGRRFTVDSATGGSKRRGPVGGLEETPGKVTAPLGGVVIEVHVAPGDTIEVGQPLMVIEAMKMQNEVQAPLAGTITAVHYSKGDRVDAKGDLLVEYDPAETADEDDPAGD